ncbi:MAG TPA: non-homologous end-joining DNA ligase [Actinomycetota bacterium]|nr:non-homologous end-joining DNA ligase [Actinomycetota bacterium]
MRLVRYGIAGLKDTKDLQASIDAVVAGGYAACEVQFVKEFTLKEPEAERLGALAADAGVALSVHAPYFAQLTTEDPERLTQHLGALHHSCHLASLMGARIVVCHPGSLSGGTDAPVDPDAVHRRVSAALDNLGPRIAGFGVRLGLETPGRKSQFGSLGDIALVVAEHPFCSPVIDFAHVHAVSGGGLGSVDAFRALFAFVAREFRPEHLWPLHCHFTDNRFGPAGEITHVPYGEGSVRIRPLAEASFDVDFAMTMISEERWETSHQAILADLRSGGLPLAAPGRAGSRFARLLEPPAAGADREPAPGEVVYARPFLPHPLRLEPRGPAFILREGPREVRLTNLDKVLFPDDGYTKGDLIAYYDSVAPVLLPFLGDRPVVMQRVPDGIYGEAFYEKQAPKGAPEWVRTVPVPSGGSDGTPKTIDFVVPDGVATLVWLAQIASVECHAWTSVWPNLDQPDFAVIDLDPHEPITFDDVRAVGRLVHTVLERFGLRAVPKTSGGSGVQIFIPLLPGHTYPEVREFCTGVGRLITAVYPEKATLEPSIPRRAGKVFIDANQNAKGKTLVAPYSVRPYPGAPVSMPLAWEELEEEFLPEEFTIATACERIAGRGDFFAPTRLWRQDLHPALAQLRGT